MVTSKHICYNKGLVAKHWFCDRVTWTYLTFIFLTVFSRSSKRLTRRVMVFWLHWWWCGPV